MRTLIIADVHANFSALSALPRADVVLCAGGIVTFGPDPALCIDWLASRGAMCVRGAEDDAVANGTEHRLPDHLAHAGAASRSWTRAALAQQHRAWLSGLLPEIEVSIDGAHISVVHAYPGDYNRYLKPNDEELHRLTRAFPHSDVIVIGHTHRPGVWRYRGKIIVNPGSTGQPAIPGKASYALFQNGRITIGSVAYDRAQTIQRLHDSGLDSIAAQQCVDELLRGSVRPASRLDPAPHLVPA